MSTTYSMEKKPVLVAGGAGFLGSLVCERLVTEGRSVLCVDNLLTGQVKNIQNLISSNLFQFVEEDIRTFESPLSFSEIWNLASPASPPKYQTDPIRTMLVNVVGTHRLLEMASRSGARFFQSSTSEVYGDPEQHPQSEEYRGNVNTTGPRACYDEGKRAAETLCYDFRRMHRLDVRVARIFNTYGPNMDPKDGRVVSNFIVNALAGQPLEIYGDGMQSRSFCYRDDIIEGFFRVMRAPCALEGPVNLGNPTEFTIRELADTVIGLTCSRSQIVHRALPQDDPKRRRPDISLAKSAFGWEPTTSLRSGLERTIAFFSRATQQPLN